VKIIDLGIAKSSAADDNKTKTGMFVGGSAVAGHLGSVAAGQRIDGRADLYSFGIVMYEMLAGVPPFTADTPHAYVMKHASGAEAVARGEPRRDRACAARGLIFRALEKIATSATPPRASSRTSSSACRDVPDTPAHRCRCP
jgi:serine/threonine-protein kinase